MRARAYPSVFVFSFCLAAAAGAPPAGRVVLDEGAYCRAYYQFGWDRIDAKVLKQRGAEILGKQEMRRLERQVKSLLSRRKIDWSKADWRDHAVQRDITISHSREGDIDRLAPARPRRRRRTGSRRTSTTRPGRGSSSPSPSGPTPACTSRSGRC